MLRSQWGKPKARTRLPPLEELISSVLSQNTSDLNSGRAFSSLRRRFPDWQAARIAPVAEIEEAIRGGGLSRVKARRIKSILEEVHRQRGELDLGFLRHLPDAEVRSYLGQFEGVGVKTIACVMLFSLGRPAFPVDTHVHRVVCRLLGGKNRLTPARIQGLLEKDVPPEKIHRLHLLMIQHGRQVCKPRNPFCHRCSLLAICSHGKKIETV